LTENRVQLNTTEDLLHEAEHVIHCYTTQNILLRDADHIIPAEYHILGRLCFHVRYNTLLCEVVHLIGWAGQLNRYSDWLRAGRSGDRIPVGVRFSAPVQTGPGAHPASCTMGTGSYPGVKSGRGVTLTPHPFLVPWS
jgi:hypothetical protein